MDWLTPLSCTSLVTFKKIQPCTATNFIAESMFVHPGSRFLMHVPTCNDIKTRCRGDKLQNLRGDKDNGHDEKIDKDEVSKPTPVGKTGKKEP